jgi:hypothetical protein
MLERVVQHGPEALFEHGAIFFRPDRPFLFLVCPFKLADNVVDPFFNYAARLRAVA